MAALAIAERTAGVFPRVPDVLVDRLPLVHFGVWGELAFFAFILVFATVLLRRRWHELPKFLALIGLYYALRGSFLLLVPIGAPLGAALPVDRFTLYPYAAHAFFPGGHFGLMVLLTLWLPTARFRVWFVAATLAFGVGTLLAKTHYSADLLGGALLAYAVYVWGERRGSRWRTLANSVGEQSG